MAELQSMNLKTTEGLVLVTVRFDQLLVLLNLRLEFFFSLLPDLRLLLFLGVQNSGLGFSSHLKSGDDVLVLPADLVTDTAERAVL